MDRNAVNNIICLLIPVGMFLILFTLDRLKKWGESNGGSRKSIATIITIIVIIGMFGLSIAGGGGGWIIALLLIGGAAAVIGVVGYAFFRAGEEDARLTSEGKPPRFGPPPFGKR